MIALNRVCRLLCRAAIVLTCNVLFLYSLSSVRCDDAGAEQWQSLYNGKDLSGWVLVNTPPETWSMKDDMLICSGKPVGEIRTEQMYQNFILELQWRHMVPGGNAGVFVWADDMTARGVPFHRSIEVQVLDRGYGESDGHTTHGDIFPIHGATMKPLNGRKGDRAFPTENRSKASPEWNQYRIECRDGTIALSVNGKVVTRGEHASPRKGYICLESEGGVVHYRNIRIHKLPDSPLASEHIAIEDRGYRSLYTGLDLSGWNVSDEGHSHWKPQDWILSYDGKSAPHDQILRSTEQFEKFGFVIDVRPGDDFQSLELLHGADLLAMIDTLQPGQWSRIEGTLGETFDMNINGKPILSKSMPRSAKGSFCAKPLGSSQFANIFVRTLP